MENTRDLSKFGNQELCEAGKLLTAYAELNMTKFARDYFGYSGVCIEFNPISENVFLVDDDYNVLMFNGGDLDLFLSTPYDGKEGFLDELMEEYEDMHEEDKEFLDQYKEYL